MLLIVLNMLCFVKTEWVKLPMISTIKENTYPFSRPLEGIVSLPTVINKYINDSNAEDVQKYKNKFVDDRFDTVEWKDDSTINLQEKYKTHHFITEKSKIIEGTLTDNDTTKADNETFEEKKIHNMNSEKISSSHNDTSKNSGGPLQLKKLAGMLKTIQENVFVNIPHALKEKTAFLKHIRDNILLNIEDRLNSIWPKGRSAEARGYKGGDHHVDFPSADSALMTISFLTFAVFLIKLVLQLISSLKAKKMMMLTPMVTGREAHFFKHHNPGIDSETASLILRLMEDFKEN